MSDPFAGIDDEQIQRKVEELAEYLNREVPQDPECLKRRYLWLTPAVLKHSKTIVDLLCREVALFEPPAVTDREKDILLFETFIASYSLAMHAADQIVQNKTRYKPNACRRLSEDPLTMTLQFCERLFDALGHDVKAIFDIYAGYQYMDHVERKHSPEDIASSDVLSDLSSRMKQFFNIDAAAHSAANHLTNRVIEQIPRLSKNLLQHFAHRFVVVPSQMLPLDGFHETQQRVDEMVLRFLELVQSQIDN